MGDFIDKVHVNYEMMNDAYGLWLGSRREGKMFVAEPLTFAEHGDGLVIRAPIMLRPTEAQLLSNALWDAGVRPQQARQSQGASDALGSHLADMRAIAFHKLGIRGDG